MPQAEGLTDGEIGHCDRCEMSTRHSGVRLYCDGAMAHKRVAEAKRDGEEKRMTDEESLRVIIGE